MGVLLKEKFWAGRRRRDYSFLTTLNMTLARSFQFYEGDEEELSKPRTPTEQRRGGHVPIGLNDNPLNNGIIKLLWVLIGPKWGGFWSFRTC